MATPNCQFWARAHRAVALAYLDRLPEAARCVDQILLEIPDFSVEFAINRMFYLKRQDQIELYRQGLRRAGVPG